MSSPRETLRQKLQTLARIIGVALDDPATGLAERLGKLGFDLIFIDCEHAGPGFERIPDLVRAAHAGGAAAVLRPWSNEPGLVRRFLDCGIDGLIAPQIETAMQAAELRAVMAAADCADAVLLPLIESAAGIADAEAILAVAGVDGVQVGPGDLAISLGLSRRGDHAQVQQMSLDLFRLAARLGKSSGGPLNRFGLPAMRDAGANILMVTTGDLLRESTERLLTSIETVGT